MKRGSDLITAHQHPACQHQFRGDMGSTAIHFKSHYTEKGFFFEKKRYMQITHHVNRMDSANIFKNPQKDATRPNKLSLNILFANERVITQKS